jgi:hypothetical protein
MGEEGTEHLHIMIVNFNRRFSAIKKLFPRAHIERPRNPVQSWLYVLKDETKVCEPITHGVAPRPNRNNKVDLKEHNNHIIEIGAVRAAREGDIRLHQTNTIFNAINLINSIERKVKNLPGECDAYWLWGKSGTGKTHFAHEAFGEDLYLKTKNKWWDGYNGERTVAINEWNPQQRDLRDQLCEWADKYKFRAEVKGGMLDVRPERIIVTSNYSLE